MTKTEFMLIGSRQRLSNLTDSPTIAIDNVQISQVAIAKSFGVAIDNKLDWSSHFDKLTKKVGYGIGVLLPLTWIQLKYRYFLFLRHGRNHRAHMKRSALRHWRDVSSFSQNFIQQCPSEVSTLSRMRIRNTRPRWAKIVQRMIREKKKLEGKEKPTTREDETVHSGC